MQDLTQAGSPDKQHTYAAIDLGSNSFHMLVACKEHGVLQVIDRIKEMVRLAEGLDGDGNLDEAVRQRALDCLSRFGQRLRGLPAENIRSVGTQTFRRLKQANAFLHMSESALGCPIDIIGGREEARLIYKGVTQGLANQGKKRLVIDIGGGSTEMIIGKDELPAQMESLQYGCVALTKSFFADGDITAKRWKKALRTVESDLQELRSTYRQYNWEQVIGSSGTMRAIASISEQMGWTEKGITRDSLKQLKTALISANRIDQIDLSGLSSRRQPVIVGGTIILEACYDIFALDAVDISAFALREGVLHDLIGRLEHNDPRENTVRGFAKRYSVDQAQARRVTQATLYAFGQLNAQHQLPSVYEDLLAWACVLHEIGLSIAHSGYQRHSGYLIWHSDMAGFTRQEQEFLATLISYHRRKIKPEDLQGLTERLHKPLYYCLFCLRLAVILARTRGDHAMPEFTLSADWPRVKLSLPSAWAEHHPLTMADLEQEQEYLQALEIKFNLVTA